LQVQLRKTIGKILLHQRDHGASLESILDIIVPIDPFTRQCDIKRSGGRLARIHGHIGDHPSTAADGFTCKRFDHIR